MKKIILNENFLEYFVNVYGWLKNGITSALRQF